MTAVVGAAVTVVASASAAVFVPVLAAAAEREQRAQTSVEAEVEAEELWEGGGAVVVCSAAAELCASPKPSAASAVEPAVVEEVYSEEVSHSHFDFEGETRDRRCPSSGQLQCPRRRRQRRMQRLAVLQAPAYRRCGYSCDTQSNLAVSLRHLASEFHRKNSSVSH